MSWPLVKIKDCCTVIAGATPKRNIPEYWDCKDVPWVTPKDISRLGNKLLLDAPEYISQLGFDKCATHMLPVGAILLTSRAPIGNVAIVGKPVCTNQGFKSLIPNQNVDSTYLYYCMLASAERLDAIGNGATFKEVSKRAVESFEIPLPPMEEQKRIAAILDKADAIRQKRKQATQLADDFLRSVFLDMFGDPVTNPKGWEVKPLQELIKIQGGYAFKSADFSETGIPVVKIGNANKFGFTIKNIAFIEPENTQRLKQYELYCGDLLMSLTGTVGKDDYANVTEVTDEFDMYYLNQRVAKITVDQSQVTKNYLKYFLAHPRIKSEITKNNRGVRQANIGNADIYSIQMPVPDKQFLDKFDSIVRMLTSINAKSELMPLESDKLFNSLSQKAFAGDL